MCLLVGVSLLFSKGTWWEELLVGIIQKTVYLAKDSFVYDIFFIKKLPVHELISFNINKTKKI